MWHDLTRNTAGHASCFSQMWKIKKVACNSPQSSCIFGEGHLREWRQSPLPGAAGQTRVRCLRGLYQMRKLYSSEVASEKSFRPCGVTKTGNTSVETRGIHLNHHYINEIMCSHFLFLPGREKWVLPWSLTAWDPTVPCSGYYWATLCDLVAFTAGKKRRDLNE